MKGRKKALSAGGEGDGANRCPSPPSWLSTYAKAEWKRTAPELHARKLLTPDVLQTFASYCVSSSIVRESEETMLLDGRLIDGENGKIMHPAFRVQQGAMREARLLAAELGLTPHRRYSGAAVKKEADDDIPADLFA